MKIEKILLYFCIFFVIISSCYALEQITTFADGTSQGNYTYTSNATKTNYIDIPINTKNISIKLNISGYKYNYLSEVEYNKSIITRTGDIESDFLMYQVNDNIYDYSCYTDLNGARPILLGGTGYIYMNFSNNGANYSKWNIYYNYYGSTNDAVQFNFSCYNGSGYVELHNYYYIDDIANPALPTNCDPDPNRNYNVTIPNQCINENIVFRARLYSDNSGAGTVAASFVESDLYMNFSYPSGIKLDIANDNIYEFQRRLYLNDTIQINNSNIIQNIINNNCNCTNCVYSDNICNIPIDFISESGGLLEYSNINISYNITELNINLLDEDTNEQITSENITLLISSSEYSLEIDIDEGSYNITLPASNYTIRAFGDDYPIRQKFYEHNGLNEPVVNMYLSNATTTYTQTFKVIDQYGNLIQNAQIKVNKYIFTDNEFDNIIDINTDVNGEAYTTLIPDTELYRFLVYYNDILYWNESNINGEIMSTSTGTLTFQIYSGIDVYEYKDLYDNIWTSIYNESITNNTGKIKLDYITDDDSIITMCLMIKNVTMPNNEQIYLNCTTDNYDTITYNYAVNQTTYFDSFALLFYENDYLGINSKSFKIKYDTNPFDNDKNLDMIFFAVIIIILSVSIFNKYPVLTVIGAELSFLLIVNSNMININRSVQIISIILAIITSYIVSHKGN